jgi:hypothetical protein
MQPGERNSTEEEGMERQTIESKKKKMKLHQKVTSRTIVAADMYLFQGRNFVGL